MSRSISFQATLPSIQSAIKQGPDESRIQLDVPKMCKTSVLELSAFGFDKVLNVTIEVDDDGPMD